MTPDAIDEEVLDCIRMVIGERFPVFIRVYLDGAKQYISALKNYSECNAPASEYILPAHSLISSSGQLGLKRISACALNLEVLARTAGDTGSTASLHAAVQVLDEAFQEVLPFLHSLESGKAAAGYSSGTGTYGAS
jgi:hypothetical protein